ncbi:MAG: GNAT family N-acetyltransferase [Anaerolineae bacterium]|nr:GNAT family N-acetyltransferase [Anaerolineae bacterium]
MTTPAPVYCPNCGATLVIAEAAGRQRPVCPECGFVHYHNPIPAVGVLIEKDGGLILIQRGQPPDAGEWALPSGFVEADESVEEAAIREAQEETGLEIVLRDMVGVFSFPDGPPTSGIIVFYRARVAGGTMQAGDDAHDVRVFPPDAIPEMPFRTHRQALARWRQRQTARYRAGVIVDREGFFIRAALARDIPRVLELAALIPDKVAPDSDLSRAATQRFREDPSLTIFVAETYEAATLTEQARADVIGFVALSRVPTLTSVIGWIDAMVVDPVFRRIGVGAALLEATLRQADYHGMAEIYVNTERASDIARAFYHASGFQDGRITRFRLRG